MPKVWGCLAQVVVPKPKKTKLGQRVCLIGYAEYSKAHRFLVISTVDKESIVESRDAIFFESVYP